MRNNADRFPRPWEGRRPDKSVSQKRAASPGTGLFRGFGGRATNKRIEQLRPRRAAQFCRMGPILHRLPVSSNSRPIYVKVATSSPVAEKRSLLFRFQDSVPSGEQEMERESDFRTPLKLKLAVP